MLWASEMRWENEWMKERKRATTTTNDNEDLLLLLRHHHHTNRPNIQTKKRNQPQLCNGKMKKIPCLLGMYIFHSITTNWERERDWEKKGEKYAVQTQHSWNRRRTSHVSFGVYITNKYINIRTYPFISTLLNNRHCCGLLYNCCPIVFKRGF